MSKAEPMQTLMRMRELIAAVLFAALLACPQYAIAKKTDIVYLKNGDIVTGEIKEMQLGEMRVNTDAMGYIHIKWNHIDHIESEKHLQFSTTSGAIYTGPIVDSEIDRSIGVETAGGEQLLEFDDIVLARPLKLEESIWDRMDKNLQLGFSYTRASDILRWNVQTGVEYKTLDFAAALSLESFATNNREGADSRRAKINSSYTRFVGDRYFWYGSVGVERNDELGIDERYQIGGGYGRFLWQRPGSELGAALGIAANRENSTGSMAAASTNTKNLEGVVAVDWTFFKLNVPRSRIDTQLTWFPGITDSGRNRVDFRLNMRQEFVLDLFWNVEFYASHDSRPPVGAISGEDYGIITSLEYAW